MENRACFVQSYLFTCWTQQAGFGAPERVQKSCRPEPSSLLRLVLRCHWKSQRAGELRTSITFPGWIPIPPRFAGVDFGGSSGFFPLRFIPPSCRAARNPARQSAGGKAAPKPLPDVLAGACDPRFPLASPCLPRLRVNHFKNKSVPEKKSLQNRRLGEGDFTFPEMHVSKQDLRPCHYLTLEPPCPYLAGVLQILDSDQSFQMVYLVPGRERERAVRDLHSAPACVTVNQYLFLPLIRRNQGNGASTFP